MSDRKIFRFTPGFRLRRNHRVPVVPNGARTLLQGFAEVLPPAGEPWDNKAEWLAAVRQMCVFYEKAGPLSQRQTAGLLPRRSGFDSLGVHSPGLSA